MDRSGSQRGQEFLDAVDGVAAFLLGEHQRLDEFLAVSGRQCAVAEQLLSLLELVDRRESRAASMVIKKVHFPLQVTQVIRNGNDPQISRSGCSAKSLCLIQLRSDQSVKPAEDPVGPDVPANLVSTIALGEVQPGGPVLPPRDDDRCDDRRDTAHGLDPRCLNFGLHHAPSNPLAIHAIPLGYWGQA